MTNQKLNECLIKDILEKNFKRVRYIVSLKADVNTRACDGIGCSCLSVARKIGATDIAEFLESKGAIEIKPNQEEADVLGRLYFGVLSEDEVRTTFLCGGNIEVKNKGNTPLLDALENRQYSKAKWLLKYGADVNAVNYDERNALSYVVEDGDDEIFNEILERGGNIHQVDFLGNSILFGAVSNGRYARATTLIERGADVNVRNKKGDTPLMITCFYGNSNGVELLLKAGANVNVRDKEKNTPLTLASRNCGNMTRDGFEMLIEAGADINAKDGFGDRAIDICIISEKWDEVCCLIEYGAFIDDENQKRLERVDDENVREKINEAFVKRNNNKKIKNKVAEKVIKVDKFFKSFFE